MPKAIRVLLIAILVTTGLVACQSSPTTIQGGEEPASPTPPAVIPTSSPPPGEPLAAIVNGQPIFLADYQQLLAEYEAALVGRGFDLDTEEGKQMLAQASRQVLDVMIEQTLIEQAAEREKVTVTDAELDAIIQRDIEEGGGAEKFAAWLQANGWTEKDYRQRLRSQLLTSKMIERVTADVPTMAEQVHARHILLASEAEAQNVLNQLLAGADFVALAQQYSQDEATKANGGDLGFFPRGILLAPEVEEAAFSLQPGQLSGIVQSQFGYHIVQVLERVTDRPLSEDALGALRDKAFRQWVDELWAAATIERYVG
ncbi:MAG: peptidylprolyl isomerase [Anaerolineae bacterium]|jgi:parvulin-like peptidyl-prolyl isomerase|nr:peptidylprolyl isomerase [Anaerolineae bacterium]MDH7474816.1 peptidylprolyl isomerase [Anaerolineae bacterium]